MRLFSTDEEALNFMEKHGYHLARAKHLESLKRYFAAAMVYFQTGKLDGKRLQKIKKLFAESTCKPQEARKVARGVLDRLWVQWGNTVFGSGSLSKWMDIAYELLEAITELVKKADSAEISAEVSINVVRICFTTINFSFSSLYFND